jgi:lipoprotein-anchoring transpeptidase ErfK/SrfK
MKDGLRNRGVATVAAGAVLLVVVLAAVTVTSVWILNRSDRATASTRRMTSAITAPPLQLDVQPADGAANVALDTHVSVASGNGRILGVAASDQEGHPLDLAPDSATQAWRSSDALTPSTLYRLAVDAMGPDGVLVHRFMTFSTRTPVGLLSPSVEPNNGETVGVAMPIVVRFAAPVANKAAVLQHMTVQTSVPVSGSWHWFGPREVHYRPQSYWPSGEKVTVTAALNRVDAGGGVWGDADKTVSFTVGDAHKSLIDTLAHTMTVTNNGAVVRTMNQSSGRPKYPTMNGVHFVWGKQQDVFMDSATVGIPRNSADGYAEHVFWNVAITTGGEYVHSAPWSVDAQGHDNVSHGCVNLSPDDAKWFYGFSRKGDIVEVTGSPRQPTARDGSADWNMTWAQWLSDYVPK